MTARQITSRTGWSYTLTDSDLDWLARMIAHEGGNKAADLWCVAQRFYALRGSYSSMTTLVRAFSEPINPKFLADGEFCRPGGRDADLQRCAPDATARRAVWQSTPPPASSRAYVDKWARGEVPNPVPKAIDFRACDLAAVQLVASGRASLVLSDGNCYVARDGSEDWPDDMISVAGAGPAANRWLGPAIAIGVALAAGVVGWVALEEYGR